MDVYLQGCSFWEYVDRVRDANLVTTVTVTQEIAQQPLTLESLPFIYYFYISRLLPSFHTPKKTLFSFSPLPHTMHQTSPNGTRHAPPPAGASGGPSGADHANVVKMVSENPVIVVGARGCCMCHVVQKLLQGQGVNPPVYEVDEGDQADLARELSRNIIGGSDDNSGETMQFPAVFVGGKFFGGLERLMATHISGELVPILKDAGALWL